MRVERAKPEIRMNAEQRIKFLRSPAQITHFVARERSFQASFVNAVGCRREAVTILARRGRISPFHHFFVFVCLFSSQNKNNTHDKSRLLSDLHSTFCFICHSVASAKSLELFS